MSAVLWADHTLKLKTSEDRAVLETDGLALTDRFHANPDNSVRIAYLIYMFRR